MKKISNIYVDREVDENPYLSDLGTFRMAPFGEFPIKHSDDPRIATYFIPAEGTCECQEHAQESYGRMLKYEEGEIFEYGISAHAVILAGGVHNDISSSVVWGVASDSGEPHLQEVEDEQLEELRAILNDLGFPETEINEKMKEARKE